MPWHCSVYGVYAKESTEAKDNAVEIANILRNNGWTLNAIAGLLGNVGWEGGYNPWKWETQDSSSTEPEVLASTDTQLIQNSLTHGYGLFQFTPSGTYIYNQYAQTYQGYGPNFSDITGSTLDGQAQVIFVHYHAAYYPTTTYPISYTDYKRSTDTPEFLAQAWFYNFERGTWNPQRETDARYWYDFLVDYYNRDTTKKWKWIYYLKRRRF